MIPGAVTAVLSPILQPSNFIALVAAAGLIALVLRRPAARWLLGTAALLLILFGLLPGGQLLLQPLEERFPVPEDRRIRSAAGIIVLGGAERPYLTSVRGQPILSDNALRLIAAAHLARRFPDKPLVYTGGIAAEDGTTEGDVAAMAFHWMGLAEDRFRLEQNARNTFGNAVHTHNLLQPGDRPWLLVTSAYHMPRAVASFRAAGWNIVPYPAGYHTKPGSRIGVERSLDTVARLRETDLAVHEWLGLAAYRLTGRTDSLYPAP